MPEGPEIRRAADSLEAAVQGEPLTDVWFAFPQLQVYQAPLVGQRVTHIETRGKALLTHFSGGLTLYSHNQLYGIWIKRLARGGGGRTAGQQPRAAGQAADGGEGDFAL